MKDIWNQLLELFFPPQGECPFCGLPTDDEPICRSCSRLITSYRKKEFCRKCGKLIHMDANLLCGDCRGKLPVFLFSRGVGPYEGLIKEVIYDLKFMRKRSLAAPMGQLMSELVLGDGRYGLIDLVVPVPLAQGKLKERGYNQSLLLAREMGRWLKLPVEEALVRVKETEPQSKTNRHGRLTNLQGAFGIAFGQLIQGKRIMLIDDVITTGTTLNQCTQVLLNHGAKDVMAVAWAVGVDLERYSKVETGGD